MGRTLKMSCCLCCLPKGGGKEEKSYKKLDAEEKGGSGGGGSYGATSDNQYIPPTPSGVVTSQSQGQVNKAAAGNFEEVWAAFDVDGDGTVDVAETYDTLKRVAENLDETKVGILVSMVTGGKQRMGKEDLKVLLDVADKCNNFPQLELLLTSDNDKSGSIDKGELGQLLGLSEAQAEEIVKAADVNGDGSLSIKEILKAF